MTGGGRIRIEVVFALPQRQRLVATEVEAGTTAADAVIQCGINASFPDHDLSLMTLGVWGRQVEAGYVLQDGDRLEIYRPLQIDPREARRQLAAEGKSMGSGDGRSPKTPAGAGNQRSGRSS